MKNISKIAIICLIFTLTVAVVIQLPKIKQNLALISVQATKIQNLSSNFITSDDIKWGSEIRAPNNWTDNQEDPSISCFSDGSFVVVWQHDITFANSEIYARLFDSKGTPTTGDILVNNYTDGVQVFPDVCCRADGNFVVVWSGTGNGDSIGIFAKIFDSNGNNISADILVNTETANAQDRPRVCCYNNNSFVICWQSAEQDGDLYGIFYKIFNSTGHNKTNDLQANTYTTNQQQEPSISCFSNSTFVITWFSFEQVTGSSNDVFMRFFDSNGQPKTSEIQVNIDFNASSQWYPDVCCIANDSLVVAYQSNTQDGSASGIYYKLFDSNGNSKSGEIRVNSYTTGQQELPSVCCSSGGGFQIAWQSWNQDADNDEWGVFTKQFDSSGKAMTGDVQVNTYTDYSQERAAVCCRSGSFIIVWESVNQDGYLYGVYLKIGSYTEVLNLEMLLTLLDLTGGGDSGVLIIIGIIVGVAVAVVVGFLIYKYKFQ